MAQPEGLNSLLGGMPFLDPKFRPQALLTAVACVRRHRDSLREGEPRALVDYLDPVVATGVYDRLLRRQSGFRVRLPDGATSQRIAAASVEIAALHPEWSPLLGIPLAFHLTDRDVIGSSSASRPQVVALGSAAFASDDELREQVLHETAHVWLYMVEELWLLHDEARPGSFALPSGVQGKTGTGVLHAAFVAAVLTTFYATLGAGWRPRVEFLKGYLAGCLASLEGYQGLTDVGLEVHQSLFETLALQSTS